MQYLPILVADSQETQENFKAVVFDGGALIHRLPWSKVDMMETVRGMYVDLVACSNPWNALQVVVFDTYSWS